MRIYAIRRSRCALDAKRYGCCRCRLRVVQRTVKRELECGRGGKGVGKSGDGLERSVGCRGEVGGDLQGVVGVDERRSAASCRDKAGGESNATVGCGMI